MLKNVSFKKNQPQVVELEHSHIFHTINSQMKLQKHTSTVGGHFHEIEWGVGADGKPFVKKVGPPITYRYVSRSGQQKKRSGAVRWRDGERDEETDDGVAAGYVVDKHTHKFHYIHSEELQEKAGRSTSNLSLEQQMAAAGLQER